MSRQSIRSLWICFFWLAAGMLIPSLSMMKKLPGLIMWMYMFLGALGLAAGCAMYPRWQRKVTERMAFVAGVSVLLLLAILFLVIHPAIDQNGFTLLGKSFGASDADDAIDVALSQGFAGAYPYSAKTFLGLPITPMPGTLLLATPFYVLGESALQNLFWLVVAWLVLARSTETYRQATFMMILIFLFMPVVTYVILQGGDLISNGIYVQLALIAFVLRCREGTVTWVDTAVAVGMGVAFSSRFNFMALVPYAAFVAIRLNVRKAVGIGTMAIVCFLLLTVPFYLVNPDGFSPLHTFNRLGAERFPLMVKAWPLLVLAFSAACGVLDKDLTVRSFMQRCFQIQLSVVLIGFTVGSFAMKQPDFSLLSYVLFALPFGVAGYGIPVLDRVSANAAGDGYAVAGGTAPATVSGQEA